MHIVRKLGNSEATNIKDPTKTAKKSDKIEQKEKPEELGVSLGKRKLNNEQPAKKRKIEKYPVGTTNYCDNREEGKHQICASKLSFGKLS